MEAVAVFSDADADALHVRRADRAVRIGPTSPAESYLRVDALIDAAKKTGCDALHPGYGFLSEQPGLARACARNDIVFVGPTPKTLEMLGDKLAARRLARDAGVPVVPGTLEPARTDAPSELDAVVAAARRVGFPLLVKATAGGGGRGMREVARVEALPESLAAASREAEAAFGDGSVYLERVLRPARHVEVQLLGDRERVVALGERDCSIQRRHQKLVEEAPAPTLTRQQRRALHRHAVALGRAAGLQGASTAEFLVDAKGRAWFLEVNTRLQVEHGITELVTGVDLVHEQLRIAADGLISNAALDAAHHAADPRAHAIEVRITAEDPGDEFRARPGRLSRWVQPSGPGVRVDSGVEAGSSIPGAYDSLMAKLMTWAPDRPTAIARLRRALDELEVAGVQTDLPFLRFVAADVDFAAARVDTGYVDRAWRPAPSRAEAEATAASAAAMLAALDPALASGRAAADGNGARRRHPASPDDPWLSEARGEAVDRWP